jgi:hypothetical protein
MTKDLSDQRGLAGTRSDHVTVNVLDPELASTGSVVGIPAASAGIWSRDTTPNTPGVATSMMCRLNFPVRPFLRSLDPPAPERR